VKYSEASSKFLPWFAPLLVTLVWAWKLFLANDRTRKHGMMQNLQAVVSLYEREHERGWLRSSPATVECEASAFGHVLPTQ
jgi:hypothetical protein